MVHIIASVVCVVLLIVAIVMKKGTKRHRDLGKIYLTAGSVLVVTSVLGSLIILTNQDWFVRHHLFKHFETIKNSIGRSILFGLSLFNSWKAIRYIQLRCHRILRNDVCINFLALTFYMINLTFLDAHLSSTIPRESSVLIVFLLGLALTWSLSKMLNSDDRKLAWRFHHVYNVMFGCGLLIKNIFEGGPANFVGLSHPQALFTLPDLSAALILFSVALFYWKRARFI